MKLLRYILEYAFIVLLTAVIITQLGPFLIKKGLTNQKDLMKPVTIEQFKLDFLNENTTAHVTLELQLNGKPAKIYYRIAEGKHKKVLDFILQYELTGVKIKNHHLSKADLPIILSEEQLNTLPEAYALYNDIDGLETLMIEEFFIIGKTPGVISKLLALIIGILLIVVASILFILSIVVLTKNIKTYNSTGVMPSIPNSIDKSIEGWKIILGRKNKK